MQKIVDELVEEFSGNIDGDEMIYNGILNVKVCKFCTIYTILFVIFLIINTGISSVFIYFHWYLK